MAVDVSRDLSLAKVYVSALSIDQVNAAEIEKGLTKAAGFVRTELGARLSVYNTPRLQFIYDTSVERGIELTKLIDSAVSGSAADDQDDT
jgi:ribosome-binding factor A